MWEKTNGVTLVGGSSKQAFAFVTAKVDNTSMTLKRVRLVNGDKIDVVGRLEIKIESKWTTVKEITQPP
jgi:ribosome-associated protein YbcJ (S4-like RNA binding protein)